MPETLNWTSHVDTKADGERDRLTLLQEVFDPLTARLLDRVGIQPGMRCLEVGAGAGSGARMLAERTGAANVTATDLAVDFLGPLAEDGIRVLRHDVTVDEPPGEFDVIHSRFMLEHVVRRDEAVRRMTSWLRPGGWLLAECAIPMPERAGDPAVGRALAAMTAGYGRAVGTDAGWANSLPLPFEAAGLVECWAEGVAPVVRGGSPIARFLTESHQLVEQPALATGMATANDLATAYATYADPTFVDYTWLVVSAAGRREPR